MRDVCAVDQLATVGVPDGKAIDGVPSQKTGLRVIALGARCIEPIGCVLAIWDGPGLAFQGSFVGSANPTGLLVLALPSLCPVLCTMR